MDNKEMEDASWLESRRLIINQLKSMDDAIRILGEKIEKQNDLVRERIIVVATDTQKEIAELRVRIAMLEVSAKIWGGVIGLLGGGIATFVINSIVGHVGK